MKTTFSRNGLTWLAYLMLAFFAFFLNVLGPLTPFLKSELGLSYTVSSLHFTAFAFGMLLIGLGGHYVTGRLGHWRSMWVGAFGMSLCVIVLLVARIPQITISAAFMMGLLGSLILAVVPAALSDLHGDNRSIAYSEANFISSVVTSAAPVLVGWFATIWLGWRFALFLAALTSGVMFFFFGKQTRGRQADGSTPPIAEKSTSRTQRLPFLFWLYWLSIVLSVSAEFCMVSWSADFLTKVLGMEKATAALAVSLFFIGMILGRLASGRLVQHFSTTRVLYAFILTAGIGFLFFWRGYGLFLGLGGFFITGLGIASLYPLTLSLAIGSAGENTNQASARTTLASGTAILTLPLALGRMADSWGISSAYAVVLPLLLLLVIVLITAARLQKQLLQTA